MKKRLLIVLSALLVVSMILSACAKTDTSQTTNTEAAPSGETTTGTNETEAPVEKPFEGQVVRVAVGSFMSSGVTMFQQAWEEKTGAKIEVIEIPFGDLYQRLFASFSTGSDEFDIAIYASNWIPEFAKEGYILSLEEYYPQKDNWDEVLPKTQRIMYFLGNRYSVPMDGDVIFGYYRKDALENPEYVAQFKEKYGYDLAAPITWAQYRDIAEFFTGWDWSGDGKNDYGVLEAQGPKDVGSFIFTSRAAAYAANPNVPGSLFFNPETMEPSINNPGWVKALNDWIEIKKFGPPEMATYGGGDVRGNFVAGNYALAIDWADIGVGAQDPTASIVKGKLGYFVLPGSTEVWNINTNSWDTFETPSAAPYLGWGGWHASISTSSKVAAAAWDFLNYIDSSDNSFLAVTTPGTARNPYRTNHFDNPTAWETAPIAYEDPAPYLKAQLDSMTNPNAQFDLRIPKAGRYFEVLDNWVQQALAGQMTAEEALNKAAEEWKQITTDAGLDQQKQFYRDLYGLE